ncbi:MAG: FeoB-associated Cys-rich membrane protein [Selenomonadaceae bacterium]|jgi:hypothetical protein|nr:FeoB-associated Cys-rich membrane protein [Selenomonadaceae bacterium]
MNFSTVFLGAVILVALFFAIRHIWNNVRSGKSDCCGCAGCNGTASSGGCCHCNSK